MTEPNREMLTRIVDSATATVIADVAASRRLEETTVREVLDLAPLSPEEALDRRLVDRIGTATRCTPHCGTGSARSS
jgi:protease IV